MWSSTISDQFKKLEKTPGQNRSWRIEWLGSQRDFIAGKSKESIPLGRFAELKGLYAVGPLERGRGEISIYESLPLISEVHDGRINVSIDFSRQAAFLVYATVENWRSTAVGAPIGDEQQLEALLLPFAEQSGIDVDQPFPFLVHCNLVQATFHVLGNQTDGEYSPELHEKAKVRFPLAERPVEIIGFYSRSHRGIFTPRDSNFHMHVRTLDNHVAGHLEAFSLHSEISLYVPSDQP